MKDYKRSLEVLIEEYPNKTGKEILEIYNNDIEEYKLYCDELNKEILQTAKWFTDNKYFKIKYAGRNNINIIEVVNCEQYKEPDGMISISVTHNSTYLSKFSSLSIKKTQEKYTMLDNLYSPTCDTITILTEAEYLEFHSKIEQLFE